MNIELHKLFSWTILILGTIVFLFILTAKEFAYSIIVACFTLISWIGYSVAIEKNKNYKFIGNVIFISGIIIGIAVFFVFGIEEVAIPRGSFQLKASGIAKSLSVILFSMVPALMFYVIEEKLPKITETRINKLSSKKEELKPKDDYSSDEWEEVSEEEINSEDFELE